VGGDGAESAQDIGPKVTACEATMLFDIPLLLLILKRCCSLRNYDADADPLAFARLHARITHSPAHSPAPSTPSQTRHRHEPQQRQQHPQPAPSSSPIAAASALSSLSADSDSPLRPEHLAHPKEVDTASPSHQSESAQDACCTHDAAEHNEEAARNTAIMLAHNSPSSSSAPTSLAVAGLHPISQSLPQANDTNGSRLSDSTPGCSSISSSSGGGIHIGDIQVLCISPASRTSSGPLSSMSQSGRLRATGGSYAEMSFKAAARPLKDSANAARQQVVHLRAASL
jgi:hypothetical protein